MHAALVRTLDELEATILSGRVLQRNPKADSRLGLGVQVRRILVGRHLAADAGILVDVHALRHSRTTETELPAQLLDAIAKRDALERRVFRVQRMAHLVQCNKLVDQQLALVVQRILLEEEAHLVA